MRYFCRSLNFYCSYRLHSKHAILILKGIAVTDLVLENKQLQQTKFFLYVCMESSPTGYLWNKFRPSNFLYKTVDHNISKMKMVDYVKHI